jgi:hypothetical protein
MKHIFFFLLRTTNSLLIIGYPSDPESRPNLVPSVPSDQGPNGHGVSDVSPNGQGPKPNPLSDAPSGRVAIRHPSGEAAHKPPPLVRAAGHGPLEEVDTPIKKWPSLK